MEAREVIKTYSTALHQLREAKEKATSAVELLEDGIPEMDLSTWHVSQAREKLEDALANVEQAEKLLDSLGLASNN